MVENTGVMDGFSIQVEITITKLAELADDIAIEESICKRLSEKINHLCLDYLQIENEELSRLRIEMEIEREILNGLVDELGFESQVVLKYSQKLDKLFNKYLGLKK